MTYRLYYVHEATGIRYAKDLACDSEAQALQVASDMAADKHVELWREDRLIKRFPFRRERRSQQAVQAIMDKIN
jgi:hypothetical protein